MNALSVGSNWSGHSYFFYSHITSWTRQRKAWHPLAGGKSWPRHLMSWHKMNRVSPLIINNLHMKLESDGAKTLACKLPKRFHKQSPKIDLDLWSGDSKSIEFLLLSSTTYMWNLKAIEQTLACIVPTVFHRQSAKLDLLPCDQKLIGLLLSWQNKHKFKVWKWLGRNFIMPTCFTARVQNWPWPLAPWPKNQ